MRLAGDHKADCMVTALIHGGHEVSEYACTCLCLVRGCRCFGCIAKYDWPAHVAIGRSRLARAPAPRAGRL